MSKTEYACHFIGCGMISERPFCEKHLRFSFGGDALIEKPPLSYAMLIWRVAEDAIDKCHCYGHSCGKCDDARILLGTVTHIHVRSDNADRCAVCAGYRDHKIHQIHPTWMVGDWALYKFEGNACGSETFQVAAVKPGLIADSLNTWFNVANASHIEPPGENNMDDPNIHAYGEDGILSEKALAELDRLRTTCPELWTYIRELGQSVIILQNKLRDFGKWQK